MKKILNTVTICGILLCFCMLFVGCPDEGSDDKQEQSGQSQKSGSKSAEKIKTVEKSLDKMFASLSGIEPSTQEEGQTESESTKSEGTKSESTKSESTKQGTQQQGTQQGGGSQQQGTKQESTQQSGSQQQGTQQQGTQQGGGSQQQGTQQQGTQQGGGSQQQGTQQQGTQQGGQKQSILQGAVTVDWQQEAKNVETLHNLWNNAATGVTEAGASNNSISAFSSALNDLTNKVKAQDRILALKDVNQLLYYIPDFLRAYDPENPADSKRIKYYVQGAAIAAEAGDFAASDDSAGKASGAFDTAKAALTKSAKESSGKLEYSLNELKKVVAAKDVALVRIKAKLALENIIAVEKEMESSKKSNESDKKKSSTKEQ